jgi:acyl-CoA thioesterase
MALITSKQIQYPLSGSFSGSFNGDGSGLTNLSVSGDRISSGSVTASVSPIGDVFLVKSASAEFLKVTSTTTTITNDVFLVKNNANQTTFAVSESIVYFATQSTILTSSTIAGGVYFTSSSFYVGLEN